MPTARKIIQDTLDTVRDTNNKMASVEGNFAGMFTGIDAIQDTSNSIYGYLSTLVTSDSFNSSIALVQTDYQGLIGGISTQANNLQVSVDNIAQIDLPALEQSLSTEVNTLGTNIASDLLGLLTVLNTLTSNVGAIPTNTYATELSNLQTDIDTIKSTTSSLPTDRYHDRFNSVQSQLDSIAANQGQGVSVNIPSYSNELSRIESKQVDHSNQLDSIQSTVDQIPTFNPSSSLTSLHNKADNQAILIGGARDTANNIYSDTQAIRNTLNSSLPNLATRNDTNSIVTTLGTLNSAVNLIPTVNHSVQLNRIEVGSNGATAGVSAIRTTDIPRLATGNQANGLQSSIDALRSRANSLPDAIYNVQLGRIEAHANGANTGVATIPRAIYNVPIANVASHAASANAGVATANSKLDQLIAATPISTAVYGDEVIGLLGYTNQESIKFTITASSVLSGSVTQLTNRADQDFLTQNVVNSWVRIDFGTNNASRKVTPNAIGLRSRVDNAAHPVNLIVEGSNDASASPTNWTALYSWTNIGFTAPYQWRLSPSFGNVTAYRHIRIRQPGLDSSGSSNYLGFTELNIYGSTNAL